MADAAYQALIEALRMIPPDKRRELVDRALEEITEIEWREALKDRFDALSTAEMEQMFGVNRDTSPGPPRQAPIDRIMAAQKRWRTPGTTE
jgi:hypothetical protein